MQDPHFHLEKNITAKTIISNKRFKRAISMKMEHDEKTVMIWMVFI